MKLQAKQLRQLQLVLNLEISLKLIVLSKGTPQSPDTPKIVYLLPDELLISWKPPKIVGSSKSSTDLKSDPITYSLESSKGNSHSFSKLDKPIKETPKGILANFLLFIFIYN